MKRLVILLAALLCLALSACAATPAPPDDPAGTDAGETQHAFSAKILSVEGDTVLAQALAGEWGALSGEFIFSAAQLPDIGVSPGSFVGIVSIGEIRESYPAQIDVLEWTDISGSFHYPDTVPEMTILWGGSSTPLPAFTPMEWSVYLEDGTVQSFVACGASPLDTGLEHTSLVGAGDAPLRLQSKSFPADGLSAVAWNKDVLTLSPEERQAAYDSAIPLETSDDGYIFPPEDGESYLIYATVTWNNWENGTPYGSCSYLFLLLR